MAKDKSMDPKIIDKVLTKTASTKEARLVAAWFATEEGGKYCSMRFDRESYMLDEGNLSEWTSLADIPSSRMRLRLMSNLRKQIFSFRWKVVAAALIPFFVLLGAFTFVSHKTGVFTTADYAKIFVPYGDQLQVVLQDGTQVQLNSGSTLRYPKSFGLFNRKVELDGEAYFYVAKDAGRPFYVVMDRMDVKVTGTKFNAKAYADENIISVALEEGSVSLIDCRNKVYPMKIGQSADYNKISGVCTLTSPENMSLYTAWRSKSLNFYRTPLGEILRVLERQYDVTFSTDSLALLDYRFSMSSSKVQISDILRDLEKVSKIRFESVGRDQFKVISQD